MKRFIVFGILALVLLTGCISIPGQPSGQSTSGGNQATAGGAGQQTGGEQPASAGSGVGEAVSKQISNLGDALAQSVPIECTTTTTSNGITTTTHYWVKSGRLRAESRIEGRTTVVVVKDNKIYTDASVMELPEEVECAWIVFEQQKSAEEPKDYSTAIENYRNPAQVKVDCHPASFGDEKFATPGKICTMDDLIPPMPELPPGYEVCEGLSGQALITCMQNVQR